jgi:hypothetical protein
MGLHGLLLGQLYFSRVNNVHTSQETHLWISTARYGYSCTFLYVDFVHISKETHQWISKARYGDSFTLLKSYTQEGHVFDVR